MSEPPLNPEALRSAPPCVAVSEQERWFNREVHAHDGQLKAYLRGSFPAVRDVDDVVQESYLRIWKAKAARPIQSAKAFLYSVARHIAIDLLRRDAIVPFESQGDFSELSVLDQGPTAAEAISAQERVQLLGEAIAALPPRAREILLLHKIDGLSQRETAERLGLSVRTVEHHVENGLRHCEKFLRERGFNGFCCE